jgi:hypothetical protein
MGYARARRRADGAQLDAEDRRPRERAHNLSTEAQAAIATAARDRRQIVTDTEGNITVVDKDSLVGRPATDADGNVLKGRQNMTESQGKAAGMAMRAREAQTILNGHRG